MAKDIWNIDCCGAWRVYYEQNTSSIVIYRDKEMREHVNDDACFFCPSTSTTRKNIEAVKKMILIIVEIADYVG